MAAHGRDRYLDSTRPTEQLWRKVTIDDAGSTALVQMWEKLVSVSNGAVRSVDLFHCTL